MDRMIRRIFLLLCLTLPLAAGCRDSGPELGEVTGVVTLDGKPLPNATVEFQPTASGGSSSQGTTDESGRYELMYGVGRPGAMIGEHAVRITTYRMEPADEQGENMIEHPEILPPKYHEQSELKREVASGSQVINFELESR